MYCWSCGKTIDEGSAFCKECGAPASQPRSEARDAELQARLDATQVRPPASPPPPGDRPTLPPPLNYSPPPPPPAPSYSPPPPPPYGDIPGWQAPPPRRRTGLIVSIVAAVVIVLAGAGVGAYFGLRGNNPGQVASSSTTGSTEASGTTLAEASTTATLPPESTSTSASDTTSLPSTTTSLAPSTTTTTLAQAPESSLHTPASGSPERKAILNALRVPVEKELNQSVVFVIETLKVKNNFAFVLSQTVQPSGAPIDYTKTPYYQDVQAGAFSDEAIGLLHWSDGSWDVLVYNVGATDVAWLDWGQQYDAPEAIFPPMGN